MRLKINPQGKPLKDKRAENILYYFFGVKDYNAVYKLLILNLIVYLLLALAWLLDLCVS